MKRAGGNVECNLVAVSHKRQCPANGCFGCNVKDNGAVSSAGHACIGDAHHVAHATLQKFTRQRHVAHFGHARISLGSAILEHEHGGLIDVERGFMTERRDYVRKTLKARANVTGSQAAWGGIAGLLLPVRAFFPPRSSR